MDYGDLIKSWHLKAEEDYFSKFIFQYLAFIAYVTSKFGEPDSGERTAIQKLKGDDDTREQYLDMMKRNELLRQSWQILIVELESNPLINVSRDCNTPEEHKWWNCSHEYANKKTDDAKDKGSGVIHSTEDWENMVEFWYTVRNNLFHGKKGPDVKRDKMLVKCGYKTLRPLVETFVKNLEKK